MLENDSLDNTMEQMFLLSGAMFAMSANYFIGTSLLRHPEEYGKKVSGQTKEAAAFPQQTDVQSMKNYVLQPFKSDSTTYQSLSRKASKSITKEFMESSDEADEDEEALQPSSSQRKRIATAKEQHNTPTVSLPKTGQDKTTSPRKIQSTSSPKKSKKRVSIAQLAEELEEEVQTPQEKTQ